MKQSVLNILTLCLSLFWGCSQEIDVNITNASGKLVVEGTITDQPGPYTIRLSRSKDFFDINTKISLFKVKNAEVSIEDHMGNIEVFNETNSGVYQSSVDGMVGVVGNSYQLKIKLENGNTYESNMETLHSNVGINSLEYEFTVKKKLNEHDFELSIDGIEVSILPKDFDFSNGFYRWRYTGTYQIGCCCWITEQSEASIASKTSTKAGKTSIHFIPNESSRFTGKYHIRVQQLSLSKGAHEFWKIIEQQQNSGSLFVTSNSEIPTNIKSLSDSNEKVLGYFIASSVEEVTTFLDRSDLNNNPPKLLELLGNDYCLKLPNSTKTQPSFW